MWFRSKKSILVENIIHLDVEIHGALHQTCKTRFLPMSDFSQKCPTFYNG